MRNGMAAVGAAQGHADTVGPDMSFLPLCAAAIAPSSSAVAVWSGTLKRPFSDRIGILFSNMALAAVFACKISPPAPTMQMPVVMLSITAEKSLPLDGPQVQKVADCDRTANVGGKTRIEEMRSSLNTPLWSWRATKSPSRVVSLSATASIT